MEIIGEVNVHEWVIIDDGVGIRFELSKKPAPEKSMPKYIEGNIYRAPSTRFLFLLAVKCTAIQNGYAWFTSVMPHDGVYDSYKFNLRTGKTYVWNNLYASWDTIDGAIEEQFMGD